MSPADSRFNEALRDAEAVLCREWQKLPDGPAREAVENVTLAITAARLAHEEAAHPPPLSLDVAVVAER